MKDETTQNLVNRRRVLRTAASAIGIGVLPTTLQNAAAASSPPTTRGESFEGVAYHPRTHAIYGDASARLNRGGQQLAGVLDILGTRIPVQLGNPITRAVGNDVSKEKYRAVEHRADGSSRISATIISMPTGVTGYVADLNGERVAFSLASTAAGLNRADATRVVHGGE